VVTRNWKAGSARHREPNAASSASTAARPGVSGSPDVGVVAGGGTGNITFNWHVRSTDTHTTEGNFSSRVGELSDEIAFEDSVLIGFKAGGSQCYGLTRLWNWQRPADGT